MLAAQANAALSSSSRRLLTLLAGLVAVGLVLTLVFRSWRRALVPMVPIALATGWSALILFLIGIPLNPMSATLGTLVIAISTEFSVLLSERFRQERAGRARAAARRWPAPTARPAPRCSPRGSPRSSASACSILSDITMLRDFGFVTLVDLSVSLAGVLLVLPAVLVLSERGRALEPRGSLPAALAGAPPAAASAPAASRVSSGGDPDDLLHGSTPTGPRPRRRESQPRARPPARGRGPGARHAQSGGVPADGRRRWSTPAATAGCSGSSGWSWWSLISIYQFATNGVGTTGVPAGKRLRFFAAPLANTNLTGTPNLNPPCTLARHDPRALNICLLSGRAPLVLSFFVTGSAQCERRSTRSSSCRRRYPPSGVQFAAVAIDASHAATAELIRAHHWTIPVAYDSDGTVGGLYGVVVCPMAELAYRGGIVKDRLIGDRWQTSAALAPAGGGAGARAAAGEGEPAGRSQLPPGSSSRWSRTSSRALRALGDRARTGAGAARATLVRPARRALEPLPRRRASSRCGPSRSRTPTELLPPDRARSRCRTGSPASRRRSRGCSQGGFRSIDLITDACLLALIETGVPGLGAGRRPGQITGWGSARPPRPIASRPVTGTIAGGLRSPTTVRSRRCSATRSHGHGVGGEDRAGDAVRARASTACRRSTSRRPCGSAWTSWRDGSKRQQAIPITVLVHL